MRIVNSAVIVILLLAGLSSASAATETQISKTISDPSPYRLETAVASNGRGYLVAWGASPFPANTVINGLPIDDDVLTLERRALLGDVTICIRAVGVDGIPTQPFATAVGTGQRPSIAWNGHEYLVIWGLTTRTACSLTTPSLVGIRVREDGSLIDPQPVTLISEVCPFSYLTSVTWSGSQYLVTWNRGMALVDVDLHAGPAFLPSIGGIPFYAASSGGDFIVLSAILSGGLQKLLIQPVSSTGDTPAAIYLDGPHAGIAGIVGGYALIWDDTSNFRSARLRPDGTMILTSTVSMGRVVLPSLAARDGRIVAAWQTPDLSNTLVCTARLDIASQPACSTRIQHDPSIGIASTSVLLAWSDTAADGDVVRIAVTSSGDTPLAGSNAGRSISEVSPPAPAAEGHVDGTVAAAWSEYNQVTKHVEVHLGGTTSKATKLPERVVFTTALDQTSPAIAAGAGRTMVLWTEGPKIRMTIVDDLSKAVVATLALATGSAPSAAFDGREWLVAWQSSPAPGVVQFAVVNSDGDVLSSGAMPATGVVQSAPAVAWSGKVFFATWRESVDTLPGLPSFERTQVATITLAGVPSLSLTLDFADAGLSSPSIASNGDRVLVSWGGPGNTLKQALFDSSGKQLGKLIEFAWPYTFTRTRTRAMTDGFATLAGSRVALTSAAGLAIETIDVQQVSSTGDFVVDPANRFTFIYSRTMGNTSAATFAQSVGLPRRRP